MGLVFMVSNDFGKVWFDFDWFVFGFQGLQWFLGWFPFSPSPTTSNTRHSGFCQHLDAHFSWSFVTPRSLLKYNKYNAKTSCLAFCVSCLGIENISKLNVFPWNGLGPMFVILRLDYLWNCSDLAPLRNLVGPKKAPVLAFVAPKRLQRRSSARQTYIFGGRRL